MVPPNNRFSAEIIANLINSYHLVHFFVSLAVEIAKAYNRFFDPFSVLNGQAFGTQMIS